MLRGLLLVILCLGIRPAFAIDEGHSESPGEHEPIPYFERYQPSFFLLGKPQTKVQVSFKVEIFREVPLYFGYSQLMIWELFHNSAPFTDLNFNPEVFYRHTLGDSRTTYLDWSPFEHESNGKADPDSRSWNRAYVRIFKTREGGAGAPDRRTWWSAKLWIPYGMDDPESKNLPRYRGIYELQFAISDLFDKVFEVNELIFRIYSGGKSWINPFGGGQELTYREKRASRKFLLPLYLQIFHGYGENLLTASDSHWGIRAGIGF